MKGKIKRCLNFNNVKEKLLLMFEDFSEIFLTLNWKNKSSIDETDGE
jgi:hypothetical protein